VASAWRPQIGVSIQILIFSSRLHNREAVLVATPSHLLSYYLASTRIFSRVCDISFQYGWTRLGGCLQHRYRREIHRYPSLAVLHRAAEVEIVDDAVRKYEHLIHRTIDQLEKLGFCQQHLDMADLRLGRRQSEGLKRFEVTLRMPVGYY
jgi:hypothetical protein